MSYKKIKDTIDAIKAKVATFGELIIEQKKKINYKFRLEWNFNSNSMEGNTLTIEETRSVMVGNLTVNDKPLKDVLEMKGHDHIISEILRIGNGELRLSEKRIKEIHSGIMHEENPDWKNKIGQWKEQANEIINYKGEKYLFASPEEVPEKIHNLLNKTNAAIDAINADKKNAPHPIDVAMEFHLEYLDIHPFYDGNGRTARILTNLILISLGYNPFWINQKDRKIYYNYISDIQGYGGSKELFFEYCGGLIERSEQLVLNAIQNIDIEEEDDLQKEISIWKKQLIKKEEVFPQSNYAVAQIYQRTLKRLFTSFLNQIVSFDELFAKKQITNHINSKNLDSIQLEHFDVLFDDIINRSKLTKNELIDLTLKPIEGIHSIEIKIYYSGFKNDRINTFSAFSNLYVAFNEYHYIVNDHGKNDNENNFTKKLYSELLTDEEIKTIIKTIIAKQFDMIKSSINK